MPGDPLSPRRLLQKHGLRVTVSRLAVLAEMRKQPQRFFRPEDILRAWIHDGQPGRISSAYRVLAELAQHGLVHRARNPSGQTVYRLAANQPALSRLRLSLPDGRELVIDDSVLRACIDQHALEQGADIGTLSLRLSVDENAPSQETPGNFQGLTASRGASENKNNSR